MNRNLKEFKRSGNDLLFRDLSQSTIGDTAFPCLVRNGTEGYIRSIITRIKSSEHYYNLTIFIVKNLSTFSSSIRLIKKSNDKIKSQWFD